MLRIVIASNNKNKVREISDILKGKAEALSLEDAGFKGDIEETGETLAENALIKARTVAKKVKNAIIMADDTGLEVDYLAKAPGVYSARFAGPGCTYDDNNKKLLRLLRGVPAGQRQAVFRTVVAVVFPDKTEALAEGRIKGQIATRQKGKNGFGYDPVFFIPSHKRTYAEMDLREKNMVSHRQKAVKNALKLILKKTEKRL
ncbi:MAG TPA: RdgB/HAM1 family non-canonical purine NTP pyrophosphatase [Candidatus Goldiibacteriota bacterium]|nr:RdgB/HAM1 family non-canonical purine NTP pyrophosphatase [Candidatus Goldiibacteriota bacterium]